MARNKGSASLAASLEVLAGAPLDAREVVQAKADLTNNETFPYFYIGMEVYVIAENKKYRLIAGDPTSLASWEEVGSGGGGSSIQVTELPTASADNLGVIYEYIGDTDENYIKGYFYICTEDSGTYSWVQKNVQPGGGSGGTSDYDELTNKPIVNGVTLSGSKTSSDLGLQDVFQLLEMPTADAEYEGMIAQYVGDTTQDYTNGYFYQCVSDGEDPATYSWVAKSVQAGGSGGGSLEQAITSSITVGGISSGTTYAVGTSYDAMWKDLLNPVAYPTLTAPSATLTATGSKLLETGSTLATTMTVAFNRGSISPAYGTDGYRSGVATDYALNGGTAQAENTFSVTVDSSQLTYQATVNYEAGEQPKDSEGNNYDSPLPAGNVNSNTLTYEFVLALWANTANIATVAKLALVSKSAKAKTFEFPAQTASNPHIFDVPASWTVTALEVLNTLSNQWEDCSGEFAITDVNHDDAAGTSVAYKRYTCSLGYATGARKIRIKWS